VVVALAHLYQLAQLEPIRVLSADNCQLLMHVAATDKQQPERQKGRLQGGGW